MKAIFRILNETSGYFDFIFDWPFPFLPKVGDSIKFLDFMNEDEIKMLNKIPWCTVKKRNETISMSLMEYFDDVFLMEIKSIDWESIGVVFNFEPREVLKLESDLELSDYNENSKIRFFNFYCYRNPKVRKIIESGASY